MHFRVHVINNLYEGHSNWSLELLKLSQQRRNGKLGIEQRMASPVYPELNGVIFSVIQHSMNIDLKY